MREIGIEVFGERDDRAEVCQVDLDRREADSEVGVARKFRGEGKETGERGCTFRS